MIKTIGFYKKKKEIINLKEAIISTIKDVGADTEVKFPDSFTTAAPSDINATGHYVLLGAMASTSSLINEVTTIDSLTKKVLNGYDVKSLTGGTGIKVTNNSGTWTIDNTGSTSSEVFHDTTLTGKGTTADVLGINKSTYKVAQLTGGSNITITETAQGSGNWKIDATGDLSAAVWGDISGAIKDQTDLWKNSYTVTASSNVFMWNKDFSTITGTDIGLDWWAYKTGTTSDKALAAIELRYHSVGTDTVNAKLRIRKGSWSTDETPTYSYVERWFDANPLNNNAQVISVADLDSGSFKLDGGKIKLAGSAAAVWGNITGTIGDQTDLMNWGALITANFIGKGASYTGVTGTVYTTFQFHMSEQDGATIGLHLETGTKVGDTKTPVYFAAIGGTTLGYPSYTFYSADGTIIKELNPLALSATTLTYIPALKDFDLANSFEVTNGKISIKSGGDTVTRDNTLTGTGVTGSPLGINLDTTVVTKALAATDKWDVRKIKAGSNISISQDTDKSGEWTISSSADPGTTVYWGNMANPTTGTYKDLRAQTDLMEYLWGGTLPATIPAPPAAGKIGYLAAVVGNTYSITKNAVKGTAALFLSTPDTSVVNDGLLRMIIQNDNSNIKESRIDFGQVMKDASSATCYFSVKSYKTDGTTINYERKIDAYPISSTSTANVLALGDFDTSEFEVTNNKVTIKNSGSSKVDLVYTHTTDFPYDWQFLDKTNHYIWGIKTTNDSNHIILSGNSTNNPYTVQVKGVGTRILSGAALTALTDDLVIAPTDLVSTDFAITAGKIGVASSLFTPYKVKQLTAGSNITITETPSAGSGNWKLDVTGGIDINDFDTDQFTKKTIAGKDIITMAQLVKVTSADGKTQWTINNNPAASGYGLSIAKDMGSNIVPTFTLDKEDAAGTVAWGEITGNLIDQHDLCYYMPEAIDDTLGKGTGDPSHFISEIHAGTGIAMAVTDVTDSVTSGGKKKGKKITLSVDTSVKTSVYTDNVTLTGDGSTTETAVKIKLPLNLPPETVITIG